jgi:hypothetical protein
MDPVVRARGMPEAKPSRRTAAKRRKDVSERKRTFFTVPGCFGVTDAYRSLLAELIDDAVVGYFIQPGSKIFYPVEIPEPQCKLIEDILQYILRLHTTGNPVPDIAKKSFPLGFISRSDSFRLVRAHRVYVILSETKWGEEYFTNKEYFFGLIKDGNNLREESLAVMQSCNHAVLQSCS